MSRPFDEAAALNYDPFEGDETDVTELSDRIVTARKDHPRCQICEGPIARGERHRAINEVNNEDRKVMTFRICGICCRAVSKMFDYGGSEFSGPERLLESRERLGERRRADKRTQERSVNAG